MKNCFTVGEIRQLVRESSNEFKAVMGKNVEKDDKSNNDKSYSETEKRVKAFNAGTEAPKQAEYIKADDNKSMLDITPENEAGSIYKERVHAQAEGYCSVDEKKAKEERNAEFNDNFYKASKEAGRERNKKEAEAKHSGLQANKLPEDNFKRNDIYENKPLTLRFKKTQFLSEEHMKSRIPDEYKVEGKVFMMKDKVDNQYLIEWKNNEAVILEHSNKAGLNESLDRMRSLMDYNPASRYEKSTVNEATEGFVNTLNNARKATL